MSGTARKNVKRSIGTIYQDFCLVENSTCLANVLTACLFDMDFSPPKPEFTERAAVRGPGSF